ncbi:MAG: HD domain-containing phosphohydrolase [Rhodanobacteraceae bacterium]
MEGLRLGMYVSRLDRPWISTPFLLEGLLLDDPDDLATLRSLCTQVYVDPIRGIAPDLRHIVPDDVSARRKEPPGNEFARLRSTTWTTRHDMQAELPHAHKAHTELKQGINEVMQDLAMGKVLKLEVLERSVDAMIESITRNPDAFGWLREIRRTDNYAYHHALSCSVWAASFGRHLGLNRDELSELTLAGLLFDVGKTRIDPGILSKRDAYDDDERQIMRSHVQHSVDILRQAEGSISSRVLEAVVTHHERHDGSGYPQGLVNGAIPVYGRILGLVDSYEAMTNIRPHQPGRSPHQAVMDLYASRETLFQGELVEQFIQASGIYPTGSLVELSDGRVGVITTVHSLKRLRPTVMVLLDADKNPLREFETVELWREQKIDGHYTLGVKAGLPHGAYGIDAASLFLD